MSKAILVSIRPRYVTDILNRKKTIEIRKKCPTMFKDLKPYEALNQPVEVYIYCTLRPRVKDEFNNPKYNGLVVAKFKLHSVEEIKYDCMSDRYATDTLNAEQLLEQGCIDQARLQKYLKSRSGYAWHISDLEILEQEKTLADFKRIKDGELVDLTRPPQSYFFIETED